MIERIRIVFIKEFIDNLRDRRSILTVLITSLFMPLFVVGMVVVMGGILNPNIDEKPIQLPVVGAENAPQLVEFLKQNDILLLPPPSDPRSDVLNGKLDVVLVIPPDFGSEFTSGEPAPVRLILDTSRMSASPAIQRVRGVLSAYGQQVGIQRLMARGIDPGIMSALSIKDEDLSTPQTQSLMFLNMLPFFVIMVIFTSGMYVIIDITAGERERGSLEPLLINPVRRSEFVLGKLLASLPFSLVFLIVCLATIGVSFNLIPLEQFTGFSMSVDFSALWQIFLICLPMVLLAAGLQMVLASFTHSFKEAQTYLSFLPLVAGLPSAFLVFMPAKSELGQMFIPAFSQGILINQVMRGEAIDPINMLVSIAVTLVISLIIVMVSIKLYERETLLFGAK